MPLANVDSLQRVQALMTFSVTFAVLLLQFIEMADIPKAENAIAIFGVLVFNVAMFPIANKKKERMN